MLNACLWGSETGDEIDMRWNAFVIKYGLEKIAWTANIYMYEIRESWFQHI